IADAAEHALATGADTVGGLVLAPHYSRLSIAGYRQQLEDAIAGRADLVFVESWHDDEGFVELLADRVRGTASHVVFTAHWVSERIQRPKAAPGRIGGLASLVRRALSVPSAG